MSQKKKDDKVAPFVWHGVIFKTIPESGQACGTCPFCDKPDHFYVNVETGQWDCKRCGAEGNVPTFLEQWLEHCIADTSGDDYNRLVELRRNACPSKTYERNRFGYDRQNKRWIFPVCHSSGLPQDLRTYREGKGIEATKGCKLGLWGAERLVYALENTEVYVCEGEWDGIVLDYVIRKLRINAVAVATPGGGTFKNEWLELFSRKRVVLLYDADDAGDKGMMKVGYGTVKQPNSGMLKGIVRSIRYIRWPMTLPDGYDVSDLFVESNDVVDGWNNLQELIAPAPRIIGLTKEQLARSESHKSELVPVPYQDVAAVYKKWFRLNDDAMGALRFILATVLSPRMTGASLWGYVVGSSGSGKTALITPLRQLTETCVFRSSITKEALVSGYNKTTHDPGLLAELDGTNKCLVIKDMTEVFDMPETKIAELFGVMRGAFDGFLDKSYGNAASRIYDNLNFSVVAGVTNIVHGHTTAHLGERMLKYQLVPYREAIALEEELAVLEKAMQNVGHEAAMDNELGEIIQRFFMIEFDPLKNKECISAEYWNRIKHLSALVVRFRQTVRRDPRDPGQITHKPQQDSPNRVGEQLLKLAIMLVPTSEDAKSFGEDEMRIVERVAFDTCIGWNLDVFHAMMRAGGVSKSVSTREIADQMRIPGMNLERRLEDLQIIGLLGMERMNGASNISKKRFYPNDIIRELWVNSSIQERHIERMVASAPKRSPVRRPIRIKKFKRPKGD